MCEHGGPDLLQQLGHGRARLERHLDPLLVRGRRPSWRSQRARRSPARTLTAAAARASPARRGSDTSAKLTTAAAGAERDGSADRPICLASALRQREARDGRAHRGLRAHRRHAVRGAGRPATARSTGSACPGSTPTPASPPCWATRRNGQWRISPTAAGRPGQPRRGEPSRRYAGGTLILETLWQTMSGTVKVIDFMPPRDGEQPVLVRIVEGVTRHGRDGLRAAGAVRLRRGACPGCAGWTTACPRWPGPDAVWLRTPVRLIGRGACGTRPAFTVRRASGSRSC